MYGMDYIRKRLVESGLWGWNIDYLRLDNKRGLDMAISETQKNL